MGYVRFEMPVKVFGGQMDTQDWSSTGKGVPPETQIWESSVTLNEAP